MIAVVDTGGANLASIVNALARLGCKARVTIDAKEITEADRVVLPGVGAAGHAMRRIGRAGLAETLLRLRQPTLGICLGMQLLFDRSEEDDATCLGRFPGTVRRMLPSAGLRIPHMGWNRVRSTAAAGPLFDGLRTDAYFYFVHSFTAPNGPWVRAVATHGDEFPAYVAAENVHAVQFHPERSGAAGSRLIENFLKL